MDPAERRLWGLALPTLGALLAQPLFVLTDTAMVGHLGTPELAGLGLASTVMTTMVGLLVFLAYATTASVARYVGAGQHAMALRQGIDGIYFAVALGAGATAFLLLAGPGIIRLMGGTGEVLTHSVSYLFAASPGLIGMLVVYAATGTLRGLSRVRLVLAVAVAGAIGNAIINALLIYGFGLGLVGSGLGTAVAETSMAVVLAGAVVKQGNELGVSLAPSTAGFRTVGGAGWPLFIRTLSLRISLLITVSTATALGIVTLSSHQIVTAIWFLAANALDAIAIAAQTLVGESLGASDTDRTHALLSTCIRWGVVCGAGIGVALAVGAPLLPYLFSPEVAVRQAATAGLFVAAAGMPLAGLVYVLDGVLIGAGDGRYLAWTGILTVVIYAPFLLLVAQAPEGISGLMWLWVSYCAGHMGARALTLWLRARGSRWMVIGASKEDRAATI